MGNMWAFLVLLVLLFQSNQLVSGQTQSTNRDASRPQSYGSCTAVNNEAGSCLRIDDCTFFYNLLNQPTLSDSEKEMLKKSQCGQDNTQTELVKRVLVCCPERYYRKIESETRSTNDLPGDVIPRAGDCGNVLENRIYGGEQTQLDEFPWMALIRYLKPDKALDFHCGGSLINHRYVLTAAHCVQNINVPSVWTVHSVRLGEWNLTSEPDCITSRNGRQDCAPAHIDVLVEKVIVHELYVSESSDQFFDIALLRLAEGVTYTDFIKPICLPISFQVRASNFTDVVLDIAGWGATNRSDQSAVKLKAEVTVWDLAKCQEKYRRYQISINESQLCAGGKQGIDTCRGDSGGPLMTSELIGANRRIFYIAGIVSYGPKPCGLQGWPGVYTRVGDYVMWLQRNLKP